jgi:hypothetical protein
MERKGKTMNESAMAAKETTSQPTPASLKMRPYLIYGFFVMLGALCGGFLEFGLQWVVRVGFQVVHLRDQFDQVAEGGLDWLGIGIVGFGIMFGALLANLELLRERLDKLYPPSNKSAL